MVRKYRKKFNRKYGSKLNPKQKSQVRSIVSKTLHPENKLWRGYLNTTASRTTTITDLFAPSQGDSEVGRTGDRVRTKRMSFRYQFVAADAYNACRIVIFRYKQDSFTDPPTEAELFDTTPGIAYAPNYQYNSDSSYKFEILYDKTHILETAVTYNGATPVLIYTGKSTYNSHTINLFGKKVASNVIFNPGVASGKNKIFVAYVSDSVSATPHPTFLITSTVHYQDV